MVTLCGSCWNDSGVIKVILQDFVSRYAKTIGLSTWVASAHSRYVCRFRAVVVVAHMKFDIMARSDPTIST